MASRAPASLLAAAAWAPLQAPKSTAAAPGRARLPALLSPVEPYPGRWWRSPSPRLHGGPATGLLPLGVLLSSYPNIRESQPRD